MPEPTAKPPEAAASAPPPKPSMLDNLLSFLGAKDPASPVATAAAGGQSQSSKPAGNDICAATQPKVDAGQSLSHRDMLMRERAGCGVGS